VPIVGGGVGCYWAFSVGQAVVEIGGDGADERPGQPWVTACVGLLSSFSCLHSVNMVVLLLKPSREKRPGAYAAGYQQRKWGKREREKKKKKKGGGSYAAGF
jgi:hypothetical protein